MRIIHVNKLPLFLFISAIFFLIVKIRTALQCQTTAKKKGGVFSLFGSKKKEIPNPPVMPPTGKHRIVLSRHHLEQMILNLQEIMNITLKKGPFEFDRWNDCTFKWFITWFPVTVLVIFFKTAMSKKVLRIVVEEYMSRFDWKSFRKSSLFAGIFI